MVEHRIARLIQLGLRQARYVGRAKTLAQLLLAATVANLTLVATQVGLVSRSHGNTSHAVLAAPIPILRAFSTKVATLMSAVPFTQSFHQTEVRFRPAF